MAVRRISTGGNGGRPGFPRTTISSLDDITITNPQPDDELVFDGSSWVNRSTIGTGITTVITLFNPTTALPSLPVSGDRYVSTATANGWTAAHIYTYNGLSGTANAAVTTTNTTLKDTRLSLTPNEYIGMVITCNGKTMTVTSNNGNSFTGVSWSGGGNPGNGNLWNGVLWMDTIPTNGMMVWSTELRQLYKYDPLFFYWRPFPPTYLEPVILFYDNTAALPPTPLQGDRYIAMTSANGWLANYIYQFDNVNGNGWVEMYPLDGSIVFVTELSNFFIYVNGGWSQYPTAWQDPVISIFDNTAALPVAPANGDRYIALVTANGWTINNIYEWNSPNWLATAPVMGMMIFNNAIGAPYLYSGAAWVVFNPLVAHDIGGPLHLTSSIAAIQSKVGDGNLITSAAGEISSLTAKGVPTLTDQTMIEDAADSNKKKRSTIGELLAASPAYDGKVKVSSDDTTPDYLDSKISLDIPSGLTLTTQDPAGDEELKLAINAVSGTIDIDSGINAPRVKPGSLTTDQVNAIYIDGEPSVPSMRTLGTLSNQAAAGDDSRLSDDRTPVVHAFAGIEHSTSQISAIQAKVGDGILITSAAGEIVTMPHKASPTLTDQMLLEDAADSNAKKRATIAEIISSAPASDGKVKTSVSDPAPGYLVAKLEAGMAMAVSEDTTNPFDYLAKLDVQLGTLSDQAAAGTDTRFTKVKVSSDDTTPDYLDSKISLDIPSGLTLTTQSPAGDEELKLAINAVSGTIDIDSGINAPRVTPGSLTTDQINAIYIDGAPAVPSLRSLGTLSNQAAAGDDSRLSDDRFPTVHRTTHLQSGTDAFILNGTGAPPSPSGLPDGTLYVKYTP